MSTSFQLQSDTFSELAHKLTTARKVQGLSREQTASVCNVSISFIRDAETNPGRCSLAKLTQVVNGLGLNMVITGWQVEV
jgi:HTH-type transcriptional regulator / antitoxin HipB